MGCQKRNNAMKKKKKNQEGEQFPFYDIIRSEGRRTIIPKLGKGEQKVHFDSPDAEVFLKRCVEPMVEEAVSNIQERVNDKAFFRDFSACNVWMQQVFIEPFSFAIVIDRCAEDGQAYMGFAAIEPGTSPFFETSFHTDKGNKDMLLKSLKRKTIHEDLFSYMKQLMFGHRKKLLQMWGE